MVEKQHCVERCVSVYQAKDVREGGRYMDDENKDEILAQRQAEVMESHPHF